MKKIDINTANLLRDIALIRESSPLVHNITNYVVMNNSANALLAIGASPVMAHSRNEVLDMSAIASSLVINMGTLSHAWVEAMHMAMQSAKANGKPIVFDPVGVGATPYRNQVADVLVKGYSPNVIRGNGSEIMALAGIASQGRGVDSTNSSESAIEAAQQLALAHKCVVVISGPTDYITDGESISEVPYGSTMMARVTGMGCSATAITGAFIAVNPNYMEAATHAMMMMGISGQIAASYSKGTGSLAVNFIDEMYNFSSESIEKVK